MKKTVLSCIQPTGDMHFGNYFGAVQNWVRLQEDYTCFYGVVDYHAMTMPFDPKKLRTNSWELIMNLIAVGVKPEHLFIQSLIPEHTELCWIFNCFAGYGRVKQMAAFKEKAEKSESAAEGFVSVGLFDYPVLQAADILIYRADYVPVGDDQKQHLELSRQIASRFNQQMKKEYFVLPETLSTVTPRIMSTADPSRKMSKSAGEKHYINVFADEARIRKQIRSAVTDTGDTPAGTMSAGVTNLFSLLQAAGAAQAHESLTHDYNAGSLQYSDLKQAVADALVPISAGFRERKAELQKDKKQVKAQIKQSAYEIRQRAKETLRDVKDLTGLLHAK